MCIQHLVTLIYDQKFGFCGHETCIKPVRDNWCSFLRITMGYQLYCCTPKHGIIQVNNLHTGNWTRVKLLWVQGFGLRDKSVQLMSAKLAKCFRNGSAGDTKFIIPYVRKHRTDNRPWVQLQPYQKLWSLRDEEVPLDTTYHKRVNGQG